MTEIRPEKISRTCVLRLMIFAVALTTVLSACSTHEAQGQASERQKVADDIKPPPSPTGSPEATKFAPKTSGFGGTDYVYTKIVSPEHWVVADYSSIWRTVDGGRTFERCYVSQSTEPPQRIGGLSFPDPKDGFAIDQGQNLGPSSQPTSHLVSATTGKLLSTTDGGQSWKLVGPIDTGNEPAFFWQSYFVSPLHGWAVGQIYSLPSKGIVLSTQDGGQSWVRQTLPEEPATWRWSLHGVLFLDDNVGWACGPSFIFWTVNGGRTWNQSHAAQWDYKDLGFDRPGVVWASEWEGTGFAISTDWGRSFKALDGPRSNFVGPASLVFFRDRGIMANENLYETFDGGEHWSVKDLDHDHHGGFWFEAARAMDGSLVAIGSRESVVFAFNSRDGGRTWGKIQ
jgi:photosystem II stability/assembly factor-like uncharacterized protein